MINKIQLAGFNNISKFLVFSFYKIIYTGNEYYSNQSKLKLHQQFNANTLEDILLEISKKIGAQVLASSKQDFEPIGASATNLLAESEMQPTLPLKDSQILHLDKSHCAFHTYPENNLMNGITTFRIDLDISTCGDVSPLSSIDLCFQVFNPDVVHLTYHYRGFTRDLQGKKYFIDTNYSSLKDFFSKEILENYDFSQSIFEKYIFINNFKLKNISLKKHVFEEINQIDFSKNEEKRILDLIKKEISSIYLRN